MEILEAGGVTYRIRRSDRRSICIRVNKDGEAEILAPRRITLAELKLFGERYADKIAELCAKRADELLQRQAFRIRYGDTLRCLGGARRLTSHDHDTIAYDDTAYYVPRELDAESLRHAVILLYRLHAKDYITRRVNILSERMGLHPMSVKINAATSHWASCSAKNTLNFSWFTIMARPEAVDYIIIHELCHMRHFNHSPKFWAEVARYCPDYERHKAHLRELWREISLENWK